MAGTFFVSKISDCHLFLCWIRILVVRGGKSVFAYASEGSWDFFADPDELVSHLEKV
jgi:hypothetical protein